MKGTGVAYFAGEGRIKFMNSKQKGFAPAIFALVVVGITITGGMVYWWQKLAISNEGQIVQTSPNTKEKQESADKVGIPTVSIQPATPVATKQDAVTPSTSPAIVLKVNTTSPLPGMQITFSVDTKGKDIEANLIEFVGDNQFGNFVSNDDAVPYVWTINLSKTASGQRTYKAGAMIDGQVVESNSITVTIKLDLSTLRQLTFEPGRETVLLSGMSEQLRLMGLFDDGHKRDLTQAAMETIYSENIVDGVKITVGDSPVLSVSADGKVTAQQPGTADVIATNNGITTARRIRVEVMDLE